MTEIPCWYKVLEVCRGLREPFGVTDLLEPVADEMSLGDSSRRISEERVKKQAATWLSKFVRWGYAIRAGSEEVRDRSGVRRRPRYLYALTETGKSCELVEGVRSKLARLIAVVRAYQESRSDRAYKNMVKTLGEVDPDNE